MRFYNLVIFRDHILIVFSDYPIRLSFGAQRKAGVPSEEVALLSFESLFVGVDVRAVNQFYKYAA